jgi:hypothetical protein
MLAREMRRLSDPDDPDLEAMAGLLQAVFPDPNTVLGLDRLREFVAERGANRVFNAMVARDTGNVVGCTVFSYVPASNCGFSEYIAADQRVRGGGLGRALFDARRAVLDEQARSAGRGACNGLFIEADNPARVPTALGEQERQTAMDAAERLSVFAHFGFKRVDVAYVQPPLAVEKAAVSYMDLLFAPWRGQASAIDSAWIIETLEPIWRAWSADTWAVELSALRERIRGPTVPLSALH